MARLDIPLKKYKFKKGDKKGTITTRSHVKGNAPGGGMDNSYCIEEKEYDVYWTGDEPSI
jgi:hypothetical protein